MRSVNLSFSYLQFDNTDELNADDRDLVFRARETATNAYAPYSGFRVGAAVRLESGIIVCGANIENAAYPAGICAERSAISNAVSNHPGDKAVSIAIAAITDEGFTIEPPTPCGSCRQVLAEEEFRNENQIKIILSGRSRTYIIENIGNLLPMQFNKTNLTPDLLP